jgi:hypothetical protein
MALIFPDLKNYKNILPNIKNQQKVTKDSLWIIFWYGQSYWNKSKNRIYKKLYLINIPNTTYKIRNWNTDKVVMSEIPEEKSFLFPLGSLIDNNGALIERPKDKNTNQVYSINETHFDSTEDYYNKGLYSLIKDSIYPTANIKDYQRVYEYAPYYRKMSTRRENVDVIIPIHVINAYYYYLSTACTYNIIYNIIRHGLHDPILKEGKNPVIPFSGSIIRQEEAKILSKYYFLNSEKRIKNLTDIGRNFLQNNINEEKFNKSYYGYMDSRIPFSDITNLKVIGQYISPADNKGVQKFLAYRIISSNLNKGENMFTTNHYDMSDLNDKRSLKDVVSETTKTYTSQLSHLNNNLERESAFNSSTEIRDQLILDKIQLFSETPTNELLDKESQKEFYEKNGTIIQQLNGVTNDFFNSNSSSSYARVNHKSKEKNKHKNIIDHLINKLNQTTNFNANYIIIDDANPSLLAILITFKNFSYYLLDQGQSRIGLLRYKDNEISFNNDNDFKLKTALHKLELKYNYDWSKAKKHSAFKDFYILKPLNHSNLIFEKAVKSLCDRVTKRVKSDLL